MSTHMLSHTSIIILILLYINLMLIFSNKISDANTIRKRNRRQFYGGHGFGSLSVGPFFQYAWGNTHNGWYGPGLYGYGWNSFRPPFVIRRRFWRRRWQNLDGLHESFGGHEFSDNFGHAFLP
ncbi:Vacuolar amino acid transporter [Dirofilaria immitis]